MTDKTSQVDVTAVQIGNAIEEKRMFDTLLTARDKVLISAITDCGGGGYSSAIGEIGKDIGVEVLLDKVPLKYPGLTPWEIWISESQERMITAVPPEKVEEFLSLCQKYDTPSCIIGKFTGDHNLTIRYENETVADLPMDFLHHGLQQRKMEMKAKSPEPCQILPEMPDNLNESLKKVLEHLNVCSKETMLRQYDQTVQGMTALSPFTGVNEDIPNDASVIAPIYGKSYGIVTSFSLDPICNRIDPYKGMLNTVASAVSKYTAVGGDYKKAAMIDNFIWPKPNRENLASLDLSVDALCRMMNTLEIPCVSGKDSLSVRLSLPTERQQKFLL
jgi:phosphoribosylformylglycinamidine synthase